MKYYRFNDADFIWGYESTTETWIYYNEDDWERNNDPDSPWGEGSLENVIAMCKDRGYNIQELTKEEAFLEMI